MKRTAAIHNGNTIDLAELALHDIAGGAGPGKRGREPGSKQPSRKLAKTNENGFMNGHTGSSSRDSYTQTDPYSDQLPSASGSSFPKSEAGPQSASQPSMPGGVDAFTGPSYL